MNVRLEHRHTGFAWFVARTQPHKEKLALANLANQRFRAFCPMMRKTVRRSRRLVDRTVPLFPGYVFIRGRPEEMRPVRGTLGIQYLITGDDGRPRRVPPGLVEALQRATRPGGVATLGADRSVGDEVRILAGPLADRIGVVERLDEAGRVQLLLRIMERTVRVEMAGADLG